ncbi:hypothetical protein Q5P01_000409 [Channa striata]|uniref:C2H2-type domain-containing protein n=1 Tax=Channa striata TaxID=64152 RepID=A0AA88IHP4_CHASR|nr:hypothetical protein Q5P01_000409 [Channa striata]
MHKYKQATVLQQKHVCNEQEALADQQICNQYQNLGLDQKDSVPLQVKEEQEEHCTRLEEQELSVQQDLQHHVCKEEDFLTDQQFCNQDKNSSLDQEDPGPLQIKDNQEEHWTSRQCNAHRQHLTSVVFGLTPNMAANMASVQSLRDFVSERLTAAAAEILGVFEQTIVEYEEEINRQRRLLDIVWKPELKLHRIELLQQRVCNEKENLADQHICNHDQNRSLEQKNPMPPPAKEGQEEHCSSLVMRQETDLFTLTVIDVNIDDGETEPADRQQLLSHNSSVTENPDQLLQQHVCKEEEVLVDQQVCTQDKKSSTDQEDPDPLQIKDDQGEHCDSQEGEQFVLKQETKTFMLTASCEESGPEAPSYNQLLSDNSPVVESQDQNGSRDSGLSRKTELMSKNRRGNTEKVKRSSRSRTECKTDKCKQSFKCNVCGKVFISRYKINRHVKIHEAKPLHTCDKCDQSFQLKNSLASHMRTHIVKKPHFCKTCGKCFQYRKECVDHMHIQHSQSPFLCKICKKGFKSKNGYLVHVRTHTGETPTPANSVRKDLMPDHHCAFT